jgi:hypothetical protein
MPLRVLALLLALAPGCRTWEDMPVIELRSIPTPPNASCTALARDLAERGTTLEVDHSERIDVTLLPLDVTLILRGHRPRNRFRDHQVVHRTLADGFDAELECGYGHETPIPVRLCVVDGVPFGVVDPAIYQRLPDHGRIPGGCHLWGRLWFTDGDVRPWGVSVILRPPLREQLRESP